ncbi:hypothetical protein M408DRAFT_313003 [Serendipita vermifera MAFF 305830]|uniref:ER membrane protein SH3 n=1 Tax=Serendipita vermifera MAFF 305830 TaxID=933852 RepID=A0A0C2X3L5_SERVB|nr:hypothetical protein M408DRAFT_313003 [Serendipita vermifera MAFF 305830]
MGFRQAAVLSSVCFLLGVLFISFNADYRVLYQPLTEPSIEDAMQYYKTFYNAPKAVQNLLHAVAAIGVISLIAKLHRWDESAMFFDGSSLGAFVFGIMLYTTVVIPGIRTVVNPIPEETRQDQVEALRVLAAGNTLIVICLGLVLAFQGGQEWAKRTEAKVLAEVAAEEAKKAAKTTEKTAAPTEAVPEKS